MKFVWLLLLRLLVDAEDTNPVSNKLPSLTTGTIIILPSNDDTAATWDWVSSLPPPVVTQQEEPTTVAPTSTENDPLATTLAPSSNNRFGFISWLVTELDTTTIPTTNNNNNDTSYLATATPSWRPSETPTRYPSITTPVIVELFPSQTVSQEPISWRPFSEAPTTPYPTLVPTQHPTQHPTKTQTPTQHPTQTPTTPNPTLEPTTLHPTQNPTQNPTQSPTRNPTQSPTSNPSTSHPTDNPTRHPTRSPTNNPTRNPTRSPTRKPTPNPTTSHPTIRNPTRAPTRNPTRNPTRAPTRAPTRNPTRNPNRAPTRAPTRNPTNNPTSPPVDAEEIIRDNNKVSRLTMGPLVGHTTSNSVTLWAHHESISSPMTLVLSSNRKQVLQRYNIFPSTDNNNNNNNNNSIDDIEDNFLILNSEQMKHDPDSVYQEVLDFLQLSPEPLAVPITMNKGNYIETLSEETRAYLQELYAPYNEELYLLLKTDWNGIWGY